MEKYEYVILAKGSDPNVPWKGSVALRIRPMVNEQVRLKCDPGGIYKVLMVSHMEDSEDLPTLTLEKLC